MSEMVWVVEISTPQLFPGNERKLGEIVLEATLPLDLKDDSSLKNVFMFARLPGIYLLGVMSVMENHNVLLSPASSNHIQI